MFLDHMSVQINLQCHSVCSKCAPSACTHALSRARHWSMDASITRDKPVCVVLKARPHWRHVERIHVEFYMYCRRYLSTYRVSPSTCRLSPATCRQCGPTLMEFGNEHNDTTNGLSHVAARHAVRRPITH